MNTEKDVYVYIRSSTDQQLLTLEFQREASLKKAKELGLQVKEKNILVDAGVSGYSKTANQRPGMKHLLDEVQKGNVGAVIVFKRDRLSRKAREYLLIANSFYNKNISLIFSDNKECPFTPGYNWSVEIVFAALLQRECEGIRDKVSTSLKLLHKNGYWSGGRPGYGFTYNKEEKKLKTIDSELSIAIDIFQRLARGEEPLKVAKAMNETDSNNYKWTASKIHKIANNCLFLGLSKRFGEKRELKDIKPIIDPETWVLAQKTLEKYPLRKNKKAVSPNKNTIVFEDLIHCKHNKNPFIVRKKGQEFRYCCKNPCDLPCKYRVLNQDAILELAYRFCNSYFSCISTDTLKERTRIIIHKKIKNTRNEYNTLKSAHEKLRKQKIKKSDDFLIENNVFIKEKIKEKILELNKKEQQIWKKLNFTEKTLLSINELSYNSDRIISLIQDWKIVSTMSNEEKKIVYQKIIKEIWVSPAKIEILVNSTNILGLAG